MEKSPWETKPNICSADEGGDLVFTGLFLKLLLIQTSTLDHVAHKT